MKGLIIKGIGGFYYLETEIGVVEAKGRGALKKDGITLAVGDMVEIELIDEENKKGVIQSVVPRKNQFIRPPIVNVDTFVVVFSPKKPNPNYSLIDKFLIMSEMNNVEAIICINKADLSSEKELEELKAVYQNIYPVVCVSGKTGDGLAELEQMLSGKIAAFAGPSGVGKSTIINQLVPQANMEVGEISKKTSRGKHTTRHVEIFSIDGGGKLFDTPGFTSFEILQASEENLGHFYPDIDRLRGKCQYDNCRHMREPNCYIRQMAESGMIHPLRYFSYKSNMEELKAKKKY